MGDTAPTPPPLLPTAKEKKYDRQLRLWAASGQQALENAHILLINSATSGVIGIETLKNLVLPGVGHFTIADPHLVKEEDLGVNFFLDLNSVGKSRAEGTCTFLKELNPDVEGYAVSEPLETFLANPDVLRTYSHILVSAPIHHDLLALVAEYARSSNTPLFYMHDVGFYTQFSIALPPAFPIVDTHPDPSSVSDLRLIRPWPALAKLAEEKTRDMENMSDHDHGHVPYVLILLWAIERWKQDHDGNPPTSYKEKDAFKTFVRQNMRTKNAEGGEENWEEAIAAVIKGLNPPQASSAVREVFDAPECKDITTESSSFWFVANAVSQFYAKNGVLPLSGTLPDMKAQSSDYVQLQTLYKQKAREDVAEVLAAVRTLESQIPRKSPVPTAEVEAFCKNAGYVKLVRGRPFHVVQPGGKVKWGERVSWARNSLADDFSREMTLILVYVAFLAWDEYTFTHESSPMLAEPQPPGLTSTSVDSDTEKLTGIAHKMIDDLIDEAGEGNIEDPEYSTIREEVGKVCAELVRAGGAELHNIASLAGGLVAQEVIKVVTQQYVPVDNTCVFNGVSTTSAVIRI